MFEDESEIYNIFISQLKDDDDDEYNRLSENLKHHMISNGKIIASLIKLIKNRYMNR